MHCRRVFVAETTPDRFPVVQEIQVSRGILAGGALVTITGVRMNEYPVLGAHFISDDDDDHLPALYGYALPNLRSIGLRLFLSKGSTSQSCKN